MTSFQRENQKNVRLLLETVIHPTFVHVVTLLNDVKRFHLSGQKTALMADVEFLGRRTTASPQPALACIVAAIW